MQNTYYSGKHYINTKDRKDLVIHNSNTADSTVGAIIEEKNANQHTYTTALESEADQLVYQLYGLTEEEIQIAEGEK